LPHAANPRTGRSNVAEKPVERPEEWIELADGSDLKLEDE